jgi:uncharacterized membrane protein
MRPSTAHTFFIVLGFLLILAAVTYTLQFPVHDGKLVAALVGVGLYLMVLSVWMNYKTGLVRVIRHYDQIGAATSAVVLGFLLILGAITMYLMNADTDRQLLTILVAIGLFLMVLGLLIGRSDREDVRLEPELLEQPPNT